MSLWYEADDRAIAGEAWSWIEEISRTRRGERSLDLIHEAIYEGRPIAAEGADGTSAALLRMRARKEAMADFHIAKSIVDSVTAKLLKKRVMPVISADNAGWSEKYFAKKASRVIRRKLGETSVERSMPLTLRDSLVRGSGATHIYTQGGDVFCERIPRDEIVIDPDDAIYGTPTMMGRVTTVPRASLMALFPKHKKQIAALPVARDESAMFSSWAGVGRMREADRVDCASLWRLPSHRCADDGRHVLLVRDGAPLVDECWESMRFPIPVMHFCPPMRGFWGHGAIEDLAGIQAQITAMAKDIQEALYYGSALKIFVTRAANIEKRDLRARHPAVIETDGPIPQFLAPNPVSQQQIQFLQYLEQRAYEIFGVSQLSSQSKNILGSNASGRAMDTMTDIESERFSFPELSYTMHRVDVGMCLIDGARQIAETLPKSEQAPWIREIEWRKVDIDSGEYTLVPEPQNFLPDTRAGRLSWVKEMTGSGLLPDATSAAALFDEPDIQRANRYLLGPHRLCEKRLEELADTSIGLEELAPDSFTNIELQTKMVKGEYDAAIADGADDEVLERYRWYMQMLEAEQAQRTPPAPPAPPMGAPQDPMAGAMAPEQMAAPGMPPLQG